MQQSIQYTSTVFSTHKPKIDLALDDYMRAQIAQAAGISPSYERLWQTIADLSSAGGKRLRPSLVLLAYEACSPNVRVNLADVMPAALAFELLHLAMLIHDDIIDRDDIRYGHKNIAGQYNDIYASALGGEERQHFADSSAILAGDILLSQAHELVMQCSVATGRIVRAHHDLSNAVMQVVGGELMDMESAFMSGTSVDPMAIARYKTASYSFVAPLLAGAHLAGASQEYVDVFAELGNALGIAYQLQDDILGVFGDEHTTGKSASSDIHEGKQTYLIQHFYEQANDADKTAFSAIFGNFDASAEDIEAARGLLKKYDALAATQKVITDYGARARDSLAKLDIADSHRKALEYLITKSLQRRS